MQTVKRTVHDDYLPELSHDWRIDTSIPYPFPSGRTSSNPCKNPPTIANFSDRPGFDRFFMQPALFRQDFEVCAVCLRGKEGPVGNNHPFWGVSGQGATVYGCITWGHMFWPTLSRNKNVVQGQTERYGVYRRITGASGERTTEIDIDAGRTSSGDVAIRKDAGLAPSREFIRALLAADGLYIPPYESPFGGIGP